MLLRMWHWQRISFPSNHSLFVINVPVHGPGNKMCSMYSMIDFGTCSFFYCISLAQWTPWLLTKMGGVLEKIIYFCPPLQHVESKPQNEGQQVLWRRNWFWSGNLAIEINPVGGYCNDQSSMIAHRLFVVSGTKVVNRTLSQRHLSGTQQQG